MRPRQRVQLDALAGEAEQRGQQRERGEHRDGHDRRRRRRRGPARTLTPMSSMPSSEMTTVVPANSTDRPAVSMAMAIDSRTSWPAWSCSR